MPTVDPYAIEMYRGDSYAITFTVTDEDGAKDLTGVTATMTVSSIRDPVDETTMLFQLSGSIAAPLTGEIDFTPTTTNTDLLGKYYYDVEVRWGGNIKTIVKSTITFTQEITKTIPN
jgi:hypothetical protein